MGHEDKSSHRSEQRTKQIFFKGCVGGGGGDTNDRGMLDVNINILPFQNLP